MKANVQWPLLLFLGGFQGWVLTYPLFGIVFITYAVEQKLNPSEAIHLFLLSYSISYLFWGLFLQRKTLTNRQQLNLLYCVIAVCLGCSLLLPWIYSSIWPLFMIIIGFFSSYPSFIWLRLLKQHVMTAYLGWNLGITGFFVELIIYSINIFTRALDPLTSYVVFHILLITPAIIVLLYPKMFVLQAFETKGIAMQPKIMGNQDRHDKRIWLLYLFIYVVFLVGGLMYQFINPLLYRYPKLSTYYGVLPYIVAMPWVGRIADRKGLRPLALIGLVGVGISYTVFAYSHSFSGIIIGNAFNKFSFAFLDVFVLFSLLYVISWRSQLIYTGIGLAVYNASILSGSWFGRLFIEFTKGQSLIVYFAAIIIIFLSFLSFDIFYKKELLIDNNQIVMQEDLEHAKQIQQNMLPKPEEFPIGWEIEATIEVAKKVGGDFFDVIELDEEQALFVIGDVMGNGMPAALIVPFILGQIRAIAILNRSPAEILEHVNQVFVRDIRSSMYVTAGIALIDKKCGNLIYSGAGHPFPYIIKREEIREVECTSLPLGSSEDTKYEQIRLPFAEEDILVLYTDGFIEVRNHKGEYYGFNRFEKMLLKHKSTTSIAAITQNVLKEIQWFTKGKLSEDDFTLLIVRPKTINIEQGVR